ncbi:MAG TPA: hypothetical protein VKT99_18775 [Xanthobacteraceae bacterium]|jgi:hypothetical protein|nr:hypothetical protein [Xanthobacteraceae bacterium]
MIAKRKVLAFVSAGVALFSWLGPGGDSSKDVASGADFAMNDPGACAPHHSPRCMVDIRYAYPAADLSIMQEDAFF